jgi:hypothetical protein
MSFRRPKLNRPKEDRRWRDWLSQNAGALRAAGLPPEVTASADHWKDFLDNGHLHWHPESDAGFSFDQLTPDEMRRLLAVLDVSADFRGSALAGWLRHRLGRPGSV